MACEIVECCQFFKDNLRNLPKTAEYIQSRLCFGEYENCSRYRIYKVTGDENVPFHLNPEDQEAIKKVKQCLQSRSSVESCGAAEDDAARNCPECD